MCSLCEMTRREQDGAFISKSLIEETTQRKGKGPGVFSESVNQKVSKVTSCMVNADMDIHDNLGACVGFRGNNTVLNDLSEDSDNDDITKVKQSYSNRKEMHQELFLQPLVAYIIYSFQSSSYENIKLAVMGHFSLEQIVGAKNDLWDFCGTDMLGEKLNRKNTNNRSMVEAHVTDILNAIVKLDKAKKLPLTVIDTSSLSIIPRSHPEELNNISLCDRLNRLEARMVSMQVTMDNTVAKNFELEEKISHMNSYASVLSKRQSQGVTGAGNSSSSLSAKFNSRVTQNATVDNSVMQPSSRVVDMMGIETLANKGPPKAEAYGVQDSQSVTSDEGFQVPKQQVKRLRRQERRNNFVQGCANIANSKIKGAPEPDRCLFIYRVDKNTDIEDLRDYIIKQGFLVRHLECVSKPESKFCSFRLTVPISQFKNLFNPSLWPEGFRIRKFVVNNRGSNNQNTYSA